MIRSSALHWRLCQWGLATTGLNSPCGVSTVSTADLPRGGGHPFFERLNRILDAAGFDAFVEGLCTPFYPRKGPGAGAGAGPVFPAVAHRALRRTGRGASQIGWRTGGLASAPSATSVAAQHSTVFNWVLQRLATRGCFAARRRGIGAATLEANGALRSVVRRDTGEDYTAFLTRLAEASEIETPTRAELSGFDRSRKENRCGGDGSGIEEVVGDKGYHNNEVLADLQALGLRSYISEPDRGCRCWKGQQMRIPVQNRSLIPVEADH